MHDPLLWLIFGAALLSLLALDLFIHRGGRSSSAKAALIWSVVWIAVGLGFALVVLLVEGRLADEYLAAYAMEKSLSLDNMFVFLLIFRSLGIPDERQHTVLTWGIFGALVFRALFIFAGMAALERWSWIHYLFGGVLALAAIHAVRENPTKERRPSRLVALLARTLPLSQDTKSNDFFQRSDGKWLVTPLLVALIAIELSDILFAVDSVPAVLAISRDRLIVYSSNAFAILGLRSLYLALHAQLTRLRYLNYGIAGVLAFAATKIVLADALRIPPLLSVAVILLIIGGAALASLWSDRHEPHGAGSRG